MKIVLSIPVHEQIPVIVDQIRNMLHFVPSGVIVLHASSDSLRDELNRIFHMNDRVFINPQVEYSAWGEIVRCHLSNFEYMQSLLQFDYFVLHASNDMYIRFGVENYLARFSAGYTKRVITHPDTEWWPAAKAFSDPWLRNIMINDDIPLIVGTQVEGSFYRKELFSEIAKSIRKSVKQSQDYPLNGGYTREEFFFSTIANHLISSAETGLPFVYSEVHEYDRRFWKARRRLRKIYSFPIVNQLISQKAYDFIEDKWMWESKKYGRYRLTVKQIRLLQQMNDSFLEGKKTIDDGDGSVRLYDQVENIFAVKRVPREYNHPIRKYLRKFLK